MKKFALCIALSVMVLAMVFATGSKETQSAPKAQPNQSEWAKANVVGANESDAELYEKAKKEGSVTIYSVSSRMEKTAKEFMKQWPGINVNVVYLKTDILKEKVATEFESKVKGADVVHTTDRGGDMYLEQVLGGMLDVYKPDDIMAHIETDKYDLTALPMYLELTMWMYNPVLCPNGVDVDSWWDFTRPEWKGKIIMNELLTNKSYISQYVALASISDQLEADYKREFGKKIEYTCGVKNAAYELVYRLLNNDPIFTADSDEAVMACGEPGAKEVLLAWGPSSKLRNRETKGWNIEPIKTAPVVAMPTYHYLYIADNCDHPNAAKLLIRFLSGGSDGKGKGLAQFNLLGGWSLRDDVPLAPGAEPISAYKLLSVDPQFIYDEQPKMEDFILSIVSKKK